MRLSKKTKENVLRLPVLPYSCCYAKSSPEDSEPGVTVPEHCKATGWVAKELARIVFPENLNVLPAGHVFLAAAHDVGKVSPGFLKHCSNKALETLSPELAAANMEAAGWERNHAEIGEAAFTVWAKAKGKPSEWLRWAEPIGRHHGVRSRPKTEGAGRYGGQAWADERRKLLDFLFAWFGSELPNTAPTDEQLKLIGGLICVSDWIASNEDFFPNNGIPDGADLRDLASEALRESGWISPQIKAGLSFRDGLRLYCNQAVAKNASHAYCYDISKLVEPVQ